MRQLTMGSLFAGIGGFDLGSERAGFKTIWQVEKNAYCRQVLRRHFPNANRRVIDVRFAGTRNLAPVDVICGGFPCQDISRAGSQLGFEAGSRSRLVFDAIRILRDLRPSFALLENSAELLNGWIGNILGALSEIGYDAEWDCIPAASVGAPTIRDRVWILAYPRQEFGQPERRPNYQGGRYCMFPERDSREEKERSHDWQLVEMVPGVHPRSAEDWWAHQSKVARSTNGIPRRLVDNRNSALGNAVVPQIPELIARQIAQVLA